MRLFGLMIVVLIGLTGCGRPAETFYGVEFGADWVSIPDYSQDQLLSQWTHNGHNYLRYSYKKDPSPESYNMLWWQYDIITPKIEVMMLDRVIEGTNIMLYVDVNKIDEFVQTMSQNLGEPTYDSRKQTDGAQNKEYPTFKFSKNRTLYDVVMTPHYSTRNWDDNVYVEYKIVARTKVLVDYQD